MVIIVPFPGAGSPVLHIASETKPVALPAILTRKTPLMFYKGRADYAGNQVDKIYLIIFSKKNINAIKHFLVSIIPFGGSQKHELSQECLLSLNKGMTISKS